ncbi:HlyD family efflux transporter periplasmic adaptor subunit [Propionivibrio sp.]|uniref:HlyD family efflux transporter periplasmic adaptor subunit n=1 Tax=Propionivibrio sp. TaxID=2212460 RepID=UPI0039E664FA
MRRSLPLRLRAALDLLRRYASVFRHVWRERHKLDPARRLPHEAQFLPAALELQDTPVSPAPRVAMWLLMAFALIALLWAVCGRIDVVAVAHGRIVPNDRTKMIQPFETATVRAIHVADGQAVKAGDVLIELDATSTTADTTRTANDLVTARLQGARARAMLAALAGGRLPPLGAVAGAGPERLAQEQHVLDGQYGEYRARLARIDADVAKREAELRSTREIVRKLEQTVPIARRRAQDFKDLVEKNFVSRHGYLEKEQARIEQEADLATQQSRLQELAAALQEGRGQRLALVAETRNRLMTLTAPVDGTVQQLAVHTVGGVVTEAQPLLMLVPRDNPIEVEAFVENKDIGFVNPGQAAVVKIETFPFTRYGTVDATVTSVSDDAVNDEKRGLIFPMRVKLARNALRVENKTVHLSPGMAVTVEVRTAQRQVVEYFLSPLLQYANESLRER